MVKVEWEGDLRFRAEMPDGTGFLMDSATDGPSPVQTLAASIAACAAMDVISILLKQRQDVKNYRVEIEYERPPQGAYPRPITSAKIIHVLEGTNINQAALKRAIELSDEKYCSVQATLRTNPKVTSEWKVVEPVEAPRD